MVGFLSPCLGEIPLFVSERDSVTLMCCFQVYVDTHHIFFTVTREMEVLLDARGWEKQSLSLWVLFWDSYFLSAESWAKETLFQSTSQREISRITKSCSFPSCGPSYVYKMNNKTYVCAKLLQSCPTLCDSVDHSSLGSTVHEILQTWILEWIAMPSSRGSSWPRDWTHVSYISCIGRRVLYH